MHVYQTNPTHVLVEIEEMEQHEKCDSPALQINAGLAIDHVSVERSLLGGEKDHQHGCPRVNPGRFIAPRASRVGVV